jgi:hypothetical protein
MRTQLQLGAQANAGHRPNKAILATAVTPAADECYDTNRLVAQKPGYLPPGADLSISRGNTLKSSDRCEWVCAVDFGAQGGEPLLQVVGPYIRPTIDQRDI